MTTTTTKIEVCERLMDAWLDIIYDEKSGRYQTVRRPKYHALLVIEGAKEGKGPWGSGTSPAEAIGDLIMSHPEKFGIEITDLGRQAR